MSILTRIKLIVLGIIAAICLVVVIVFTSQSKAHAQSTLETYNSLSTKSNYTKYNALQLASAASQTNTVTTKQIFDMDMSMEEVIEYVDSGGTISDEITGETYSGRDAKFIAAATTMVKAIYDDNPTDTYNQEAYASCSYNGSEEYNVRKDCSGFSTALAHFVVSNNIERDSTAGMINTTWQSEYYNHIQITSSTTIKFSDLKIGDIIVYRHRNSRGEEVGHTFTFAGIFDGYAYWWDNGNTPHVPEMYNNGSAYHYARIRRNAYTADALLSIIIDKEGTLPGKCYLLQLK